MVFFLEHVNCWERARELLKDYKAQACGESWTLPASGSFKLNVDTALNGDKGKYGAGMVIGNDKGKVIMTAALSFKGKVPVDIALWCFKLNVDAALNGDKGRYGAGMVIRNDKGKVVITAALSYKGKVPVDIAMAVAVLEGIFMAEKFGLFPLCIEPNALGIVRLCNGVISLCYDINNIICDVVALKGKCTKFAESIAKFVVASGFSGIWHVDFLEWLSLLANSDLNSCNSFLNF
ncbi:hypothetical protein LWI29_014843 [Acer saccharum]|uniref:RNase H type-1 domain-containing protein n=1 Tax=Acer saccharum TaxID=4024 RepID=A0AA39VZM3_ACESA|nr:hypothetical protein LWI29_014843 [Acer saccharum]